MRSTHHTLLHEASEEDRAEWEEGFNYAAKYLEKLAPPGLEEAVLAVLQVKGAWCAIFGWPYDPWYEGLVHGIGGLAALRHPDQVRWAVTSPNEEDPLP